MGGVLLYREVSLSCFVFFSVMSCMEYVINRKPLTIDWMTSKRFVSANLLIYTLFTGLYLYIGMKEHFDTPNTLTNAMYYAATTHSTTGYGDIIPKTSLAKMLATAHMFCVWILIAIATSWAFDKSEESRR